MNNVIIMKKLFSFVLIGLFVGLSFACEEETVIDDFPTLGRAYVYPFPGCDNSANPIFSCEDWVEFTGNSQANILIGGGDIVQRRAYRVDGTQITVYDETGLSSLSDLLFEYISNDTLQRMADNSFWVLRD